MAIKAPKRQRISIHAIKQDWAHNHREPDAKTYDDPNMRGDLQEFGQRTTMKLEKHTEGDGAVHYSIIQGNRRAHNIKILADAGVTNPQTGKVFDEVDAEVYEGLTEMERIQLALDQNSIRGLELHELFYAAERTWNAGYNDRQTVVQLSDLFNHFFKPNRPVKPISEDKGADLLNYHKGTLQTWKMAYNSPVVLRNAFVDRLKGKHRWPSVKELAELYSVYDKATKQDTTGELNRENPGVEFVDKWTHYVANIETAVKAGNKPKAQSMMARAAVEELKTKRYASRILKLALGIVLREVPADQGVALDKMLKALEARLTPEEVTVIDGAFKAQAEVVSSGKPADEPEAEPVAAEPAAAEPAAA